MQSWEGFEKKQNNNNNISCQIYYGQTGAVIMRITLSYELVKKKKGGGVLFNPGPFPLPFGSIHTNR